jgi:hypothetical protein
VAGLEMFGLRRLFDISNLAIFLATKNEKTGKIRIKIKIVLF